MEICLQMNIILKFSRRDKGDRAGTQGSRSGGYAGEYFHAGFMLKTEDGTEVKASDLTADGKHILMFLEEEKRAY